MVNFGLNSASILGLFLAVAGASLYFVRSVRPELARDQDIFFAGVGLVCGIILMFQGWRLDPILQLNQFLLIGSVIFFAIEAIRMRGIATEQARRNTPIVDEDRPVSRVYRAELDQLEPYDTEEPDYDNPRLRGYSDPRSGRSRSYEGEQPRSGKNRRSTDSYYGDYGENPPPRSRKTRPGKPSRGDRYPQREDTEAIDQQPPMSRSRPQASNPPSSSRRSKSGGKPLSELGRNYYDESGVNSADYVDYQPIDNEDLSEDIDTPSSVKPRRNEPENPVNFDY